MKRIHWLRHVALMTVLALVVAACGNGDDAPAEPPAAEEPAAEAPDDADAAGLVLGYILPESGPLAFLGPPQIEAVRMAVEDINAAGGVLGQEVTLLTGDEAGDESIARQSAERLIAEGVHGIVGAAASGMSLAFIDALYDNEIVQCSGSNTAPTFTTHEFNAFYFRTAPPDSGQGPVLAETIIGDGHTSVSLMARADDYGRGLMEITASELEAQGADVQVQVTYDPEAASFDADVEQAIAGNPDAVVVVGFDEGAQILQVLIEAGYTAGQLYGADGMKSSELASLVDPNNAAVLDGMKGTAPGADLDFNLRLFERLPDENAIFGGQAYDCAIAIALAAEAAGTTDPAVFVDFMIPVVGDGTECTSFAECKDLLEAGEDINYNGPSGPIAWTAAGADPSFAVYEIWQIDETGNVSQIGSAAAELG